MKKMNEIDFKSKFNVIAGPCAVESYDSLFEIASFLQGLGVQIIRGGSFKLRTSVDSFQGLGEEAIRYLVQVCQELGLFSLTEVVELRDLHSVFQDVDVLMVGARNMYNYPLLKELSMVDKPIILKRAMSATIKEWLSAAEYLQANGNDNIILCERGIRTFETATRNTLDLSAVPIVKSMSDYPIIVDPSHSTGNSEFVPSMSMAAVAAGADGLIIEIHKEPKKSLSDAKQLLDFESFEDLYKAVNSLKNYLG